MGVATGDHPKSSKARSRYFPQLVSQHLFASSKAGHFPGAGSHSAFQLQLFAFFMPLILEWAGLGSQ
jgi:hypothetical protein